MQVRLRTTFLALLGLAVLSSACGSDRTYNTNKADKDYNLDEMVLRNVDAPAGILNQVALAFDNARWAELSSEDPEQAASTLDRQNRLTNYFAIFGADFPPAIPSAKPLLYTAQSTLYKDVESARRSFNDSRLPCGMPPAGLLMAFAGIEEPDPSLSEFPQEFPEDIPGVPKIGEETIAFAIVHADKGSALTAICFRTGRIVHLITATGYHGSEDIGQSVRLARRMLVRVEQALDGKPAPKDIPAKQDS